MEAKCQAVRNFEVQIGVKCCPKLVNDLHALTPTR